MPVLQCVMTSKYKIPGLNLITGAVTVTTMTIVALVDLIDKGIPVRVTDSRLETCADGRPTGARDSMTAVRLLVGPPASPRCR